MPCVLMETSQRRGWNKAGGRTAPEPPAKGEEGLNSAENIESSTRNARSGECTSQMATDGHSVHRIDIGGLQAALRERESTIEKNTKEIKKAKAREAALLSEVTAERKLHNCERRHYEETIKSLRRQRDQAERDAKNAKGVSISLQIIIGDLQCRAAEKDREISSLKRLAEEKTEQSCTLQADIEELKWKLANERSRSETFRKNIQEGALEAHAIKGRVVDDQHQQEEEIRRLRSRIAEEESRLAEKDEEIRTMQDSLRDSVDQNGALIDEVIRLKDEVSHLQSSGSATSHEPCDRMLEKERQKVRELREEICEKNDDRARFQKDFEDICERMKDLSKSRQEEVDELQAKTSELEAEVVVKEKEIGILKLSLKEAELKKRGRADHRRADGAGSDKALSHATNEEDKAGAVAKIPEGYEQRIENLKTENETLRSMFTSLWDEATELRSKVTKLNDSPSPKTLQELEHRNKSLERYIAKLEKSIRRVLV